MGMSVAKSERAIRGLVQMSPYDGELMKNYEDLLYQFFEFCHGKQPRLSEERFSELSLMFDKVWFAVDEKLPSRRLKAETREEQVKALTKAEKALSRAIVCAEKYWVQGDDEFTFQKEVGQKLSKALPLINSSINYLNGMPKDWFRKGSPKNQNIQVLVHHLSEVFIYELANAPDIQSMVPTVPRFKPNFDASLKGERALNVYVFALIGNFLEASGVGKGTSAQTISRIVRGDMDYRPTKQRSLWKLLKGVRFESKRTKGPSR